MLERETKRSDHLVRKATEVPETKEMTKRTH